MYILQPSVNNGKCWSIMADSNTNMMRGLVCELFNTTKAGSLEFSVVGPAIEDCDVNLETDLFANLGEEVDSAIKGGHLRYIQVHGRPIDAVSYRYDFHIDRDLKHIQAWWNGAQAEHLVFWNNIPELTANYMNFFNHPKEGKKDVLFVNSCYFLDSPVHPKTGVDRDIHHKAVNWSRQVEGALRADIAGFCCDGNRHQFFEGLATTHSEEIQQAIAKNAWVFRFGYSETELDGLVDGAPHVADICAKATASGKMLVTFPNRITDPDYTNGQAFLQAMFILGGRRDDFVWTVTNPGQKYITNRELAEAHSNYLLISENDLSRAEYITLLGNTDFHCSLFVEEANGGCACREAMHLKSFPIMPFENEYTRLARADWPGFFNTNGKDVDVDAVVNALDECMTLLQDAEWWSNRVSVMERYEFKHEQGSFRESTKEVLAAFAQHGITLQ